MMTREPVTSPLLKKEVLKNFYFNMQKMENILHEF